MKYKLIIFVLLVFPIFAVSANYTIQCNNVDEIVRGYLEELVAEKIRRVDANLECKIIVSQQDNTFTIAYSSSVGDGILSTENVYDDLENMVFAMVSDLQQKWNEQHPIIVESPTIKPTVETDKAQEPIAEINSKAVQQSPHSAPARQTYSETIVVTAEEPQKKSGEKIKQAFITFGQAFKNFGQTFKKNYCCPVKTVKPTKHAQDISKTGILSLFFE